MPNLQFETLGYANGSQMLRLTKSHAFFGSWGCIVVPKGFVTDGASVPRFFWNVLGPLGPYFDAAVLHDFLYSPINATHTREQADLIFLEAMQLTGVGWITRNLVFTAVRACGWQFYGGHQTQE